MLFSSIEFIIFFLLVISILLFLQFAEKINLKKSEDNVSQTKNIGQTLQSLKYIFLSIASYVFYGWWDYRFCFLMFFLSFIAYHSAKQINIGKNVKFYKTIGIVVPLIVLGFFKYFNFFIDSFVALFGTNNIEIMRIILPVGISFYTFQSISYTLDVSRGEVKSASFLKVILYISFFPQIVAGPIVKASDFLPQLEQKRNINVRNVEIGIQIFAFGLFKKIVIADNLARFVDVVFDAPLAFHSITVILALVAYSIQIYCDFSGYSDMAVGCAKVLGYDFERNFNLPYIAKNVTEFWKRWHISLSQWLQKYLYISLGGNRKGKKRTYVNLLITMILGGLWHGASWNFVIWGALHGAALCVHKIFLNSRKNKIKKASFFKTLCSILLTYVFVCICWIFFRCSDLEQSFIVVQKILFINHDGVLFVSSWTTISFMLVAFASFAAFIRTRKLLKINRGINSVDGFYVILDLNKILYLTIFLIFLGLTIGLAHFGDTAFIYFQF